MADTRPTRLASWLLAILLLILLLGWVLYSGAQQMGYGWQW